MKWAYYNEIDPYAAQWLRNLIKANLIAPGVVDERSISDVKPAEIREFTQCHFFAGIGVWSYALRAAGWDDDKPVWTGSCPCQPFSNAGSKRGFSDERHLWPHWLHLIQVCQPETVFGEQVASKDGLSWLDLVQTDLEASGYANAAADICAAGVGAPHIRQRLWFVAMRKKIMADAFSIGCERERWQGQERTAEHSKTNPLADGDDHRQQSSARNGSGSECAITGYDIGRGGEVDPLPNTTRKRIQGEPPATEPTRGQHIESGLPVNGFWSGAIWIPCRDGKYRAIEPSIKPLVNGATARVGRLRAYGNAINSEVARAFIEVAMKYLP